MVEIAILADGYFNHWIAIIHSEAKVGELLAWKKVDARSQPRVAGDTRA